LVEHRQQSDGAGAIGGSGGSVSVEQGPLAIEDEIAAELQDVFTWSREAGSVSPQQTPEVAEDHRGPEKNPRTGPFQSQGLIKAALRVGHYSDFPALCRSIASQFCGL